MNSIPIENLRQNFLDRPEESVPVNIDVTRTDPMKLEPSKTNEGVRGTGKKSRVFRRLAIPNIQEIGLVST